MPWKFTYDATQFCAAARGLLTERAAEHTIALTNLDNVLAGRTDGGELFAWYTADNNDRGDRGAVVGAVSRTPGRPLLVSELPEGSEDELALRYPEHGGAVRGLVGEPDAVGRLAERWSAINSTAFRVQRRERLYHLDQLLSPDVPGSAHRATTADTEVVVRWFAEFIAEAEGGPIPPAHHIRDRIERNLGWLWHAASGEPVSMAFRHAPVAGVIRVGPVYTPPEHRRRGYAAGVTAAATADGLNAGASAVVLFTDLANPTSNSVYQSIGYRPLSDRVYAMAAD